MFIAFTGRRGRASGDYFDIFPLGQGRMRVAIADVSGHGARAAFIMAIVRTLFRVSCDYGTPLGETFTQINRHLCDIIGREEDFVTAFAADIDLGQRTLRYVNAGHCPALIADDAKLGRLPATARILGFFADEEFAEHEEVLPERGGLLLYTDGFYDFMTESGGFFDHEAFCALATEVMSFGGHVPRHIEAVVGERCGEACLLRDDVTSLWISIGEEEVTRRYSCEARASEVRRLVWHVREGLEQEIMDDAVLSDIDLALTEACANVVEHAYPGQEAGQLSVRVLALTGSHVALEVEDWGIGFVPPHDPAPPAQESDSGRGLFIMHRLMDGMQIHSSPGKTRVLLRKNIGGGAWKTW